MLPNPYTPGAGLVPSYLAGRDDTISEAREVIVSVAHGFPTRSIVYYGLRGVGKTVLLNRIEEIAEENLVLYEHIEVSERSSFKISISFHIQKLIRQLSTKKQAKFYLDKALSILKAFQITYSPEGEVSLGLKDNIDAAVGVSDTGNFQNDLTELFVSLGTLAQKNDNAVCLFIDEIQYLKDDEFEALIAAIHRVNQKGLPVTLFSAGLPKVAKIAGDIKSYAERLVSFISIDSLEPEAAKLALTEPAKKLGVTYTDEAIDKIITITDGYPYFLQEYGKQVWAFIKDNKIDITSVEAAYPIFEKSLDDSFFKVRYDRATPKEKEVMIAMAECGALPCTMAQIASRMQTSVQSISPVRGQLIYKGFIYSARYGEVDFTVPQFKQYLKRIQK
ncbi:MAG TPA: ATP-binding protein [Methylomusa anaerophila]|uniref:Archaeal ATPase n=1 Tax=Methylomusa anaerophila TaxID=1930071 RepID=A0A348AI12_9FIRM|nr:ATP-binding protein [Methylomusa anaerophila]BBB90710.1 archaeal ATPase [Methylomusa anaerophila]HML88687.1 ATP-binding protein [Methylomusa anaerophila]